MRLLALLLEAVIRLGGNPMFTHVADSELLYILVKLAVLAAAVGLWWMLATPVAV